MRAFSLVAVHIVDLYPVAGKGEEERVACARGLRRKFTLVLCPSMESSSMAKEILGKHSYKISRFSIIHVFMVSSARTILAGVRAGIHTFSKNLRLPVRLFLALRHHPPTQNHSLTAPPHAPPPHNPHAASVDQKEQQPTTKRTFQLQDEPPLTYAPHPFGGSIEKSG